MVQVIVFVLLVMAVVIVWRHASRQKKYLAASAARQGARNSYHCVEVRTGVPACEAAQHLGNVRFLSKTRLICQCLAAPSKHAHAAISTTMIAGKTTAATRMECGQTFPTRLRVNAVQEPSGADLRKAGSAIDGTLNHKFDGVSRPVPQA